METAILSLQTSSKMQSGTRGDVLDAAVERKDGVGLKCWNGEVGELDPW